MKLPVCHEIDNFLNQILACNLIVKHSYETPYMRCQ